MKIKSKIIFIIVSAIIGLFLSILFYTKCILYKCPKIVYIILILIGIIIFAIIHIKKIWKILVVSLLFIFLIILTLPNIFTFIDNVRIHYVSMYMTIGEYDKAINEAENIWNRDKKNFQLEGIANTLAWNGYIDKALKVSEKIDDNFKRIKELFKVGNILIYIGGRDNILEIAHELVKNHSMGDFYYRMKWLKKLHDICLKNTYFNYIIKMKIKNSDDNKSEKLYFTVKQLLKENKINDALSIANNIQDKIYKILALSLIGEQYAKKVKISEANIIFNEIINNVQQIENNKYKLYVLYFLSEVLIRIEKYYKKLGDDNKIKINDKKFHIFSKNTRKISILLSNSMANKIYVNATTQIEKIFNNINNRDRLDWCLKKLRKYGKIDVTIKKIEKMCNGANDINKLSWCIEKLATLGKIDEAINILLNIKDENYRSDIAYEIAKIIIKKNKLEKALMLTKIIKNEEYYNSKSAILSLITKKLVKENKINKALQIAEKINDPIYKTDALNVIAEKLNKNGKVNMANKIYNETIKFAENKNPEIAFYKYTILCKTVKSLISIGKYSMGMKIIRNLRRRALQDFLCVSVIIDDLLKAGKIDYAIEIIKKIKAYYYPEGLNKIVNTLLGRDQVDEAIRVVNMFKNKYSISDSAYLIVDRLIKENKIDKALEVSKVIADKYKRNNSLFLISKKLIEIGRKQEAYTIINKILKNIKEINEYKDNSLLEDIVEQLIRINKIDIAIQVAEKINDKYEINRSLILISKEMIEVGRKREAYTIINAVLKNMKGINGYSYNFLLDDIVYQLIRINKIDMVIQTAEKMDSKFLMSAALSRIINALLKEERIDKALKVVKKIKDNDCKVSAYYAIAQFYDKKEEYEKAIKMLTKAQKIAKKSKIYYQQTKISKYLKEIQLKNSKKE